MKHRLRTTLSYSTIQLVRIYILIFSESVKTWSVGKVLPANTRQWPNAVSLLALCLRRSARSKTTSGQCLLFVELISYEQTTYQIFSQMIKWSSSERLTGSLANSHIPRGTTSMLPDWTFTASPHWTLTCSWLVPNTVWTERFKDAR